MMNFIKRITFFALIVSSSLMAAEQSSSNVGLLPSKDRVQFMPDQETQDALNALWSPELRDEIHAALADTSRIYSDNEEAARSLNVDWLYFSKTNEAFVKVVQDEGIPCMLIELRECKGEDEVTIPTYKNLLKNNDIIYRRAGIDHDFDFSGGTQYIDEIEQEKRNVVPRVHGAIDRYIDRISEPADKMCDMCIQCSDFGEQAFAISRKSILDILSNVKTLQNAVSLDGGNPDFSKTKKLLTGIIKTFAACKKN